jgi:pimeloyl-ACP methyl ester carboxylesterase
MPEKLFFSNSKGEQLCGIISNPTVDKNKFLVILCHGFSTNKNAGTYLKLEKILNQKEISTFRFDFYGHGESSGKFEDITISEAVDDILNSIKFLKNLGYNKLGLFGSSFGGIASLIAASKTKELSFLILKSPVSNYEDLERERKSLPELKEWQEKGFSYYHSGKRGALKLNYSFFEDSKNNNGYDAAKKIKIPTLIIHGDKDSVVPIEQSKKTSRIIKNCTFKIISGANHDYGHPGEFEKMLDHVVEFAEEHSKTDQ